VRAGHTLRSPRRDDGMLNLPWPESRLAAQGGAADGTLTRSKAEISLAAALLTREAGREGCAGRAGRLTRAFAGRDRPRRQESPPRKRAAAEAAAKDARVQRWRRSGSRADGRELRREVSPPISASPRGAGAEKAGLEGDMDSSARAYLDCCWARIPARETAGRPRRGADDGADRRPGRSRAQEPGQAVAPGGAGPGGFAAGDRDRPADHPGWTRLSAREIPGSAGRPALARDLPRGCPEPTTTWCVDRDRRGRARHRAGCARPEPRTTEAPRKRDKPGRGTGRTRRPVGPGSFTAPATRPPRLWHLAAATGPSGGRDLLVTLDRSPPKMITIRGPGHDPGVKLRHCPRSARHLHRSGLPRPHRAD